MTNRRRFVLGALVGVVSGATFLPGCAGLSHTLDTAAAQVADLPPKTWVLALRGAVLPTTPGELALITVTGGPLDSPVTLPGVTPRPLVIDGPPETPLKPTGELVIRVMAPDGERQVAIPLSDLFLEPLLGYVDITVTQGEVEVHASRYVLGRGVDYTTGNIYRKTTPIAIRRYTMQAVR